MTLLPMAQTDAELLGLKILGWIAEDDDRINRLLGLSGLGAGDLRERAGDPDFLGFVLDFLLADEEMLIASCDALAVPPDQPMRARAALPGGDLPHWT